MKANWLSDARKIPGEVMNYIRRLAVRAVEEKHHSPEVIADILGISRSSITVAELVEAMIGCVGIVNMEKTPWIPNHHRAHRR